jgi:hypothetical protein
VGQQRKKLLFAYCLSGDRVYHDDRDHCDARVCYDARVYHGVRVCHGVRVYHDDHRVHHDDRRVCHDGLKKNKNILIPIRYYKRFFFFNLDTGH